MTGNALCPLQEFPYNAPDSSSSKYKVRDKVSSEN
jgi:hypothetical protein